MSDESAKVQYIHHLNKNLLKLLGAGAICNIWKLGAERVKVRWKKTLQINPFKFGVKENKDFFVFDHHQHQHLLWNHHCFVRV